MYFSLIAKCKFKSQKFVLAVRIVGFWFVWVCVLFFAKFCVQRCSAPTFNNTPEHHSQACLFKVMPFSSAC